MTLTAGVGSDGNVVAVAGEKGVVLAYDSDGKFLWKAQASSEVLSTPLVGGGLVVVRSVDNHLVAYDAENGERRWAIKRSAPALTLRSAPGMVIAGPTIVAALPGGRMLSIMMASGGVRWEVAVGQPHGATEIERVADISGYPAGVPARCLRSVFSRTRWLRGCGNRSGTLGQKNVQQGGPSRRWSFRFCCG